MDALQRFAEPRQRLRFSVVLCGPLWFSVVLCGPLRLHLMWMLCRESQQSLCAELVHRACAQSLCVPTAQQELAGVLCFLARGFRDAHLDPRDLALGQLLECELLDQSVALRRGSGEAAATAVSIEPPQALCRQVGQVGLEQRSQSTSPAPRRWSV